MRRAVVFGMMALVATGCTRVQETETLTYDAFGIGTLRASTDDGRITYDGTALFDEVTLDVTRWGTGSSKGRAEDHMEDARYDVAIDGDLLSADGIAGYRSGVDFDIRGPDLMHTDLFNRSGPVDLRNVDGVHVVTATSIFGRNVIGEGDFFADGGRVDLQVTPYFSNSVVYIESNGGDVEVGLPYGYDYDLTITTDLDYELAIEDLGFDTLLLDPGLAIGRRGFRDVRVDIQAFNANVYVYGI